MAFFSLSESDSELESKVFRNRSRRLESETCFFSNFGVRVEKVKEFKSSQLGSRNRSRIDNKTLSISVLVFVT